ncbi:DUF6364 family protein [Gracilinema caldarium]|jgi:predicted nucleic acid-binding protein|uniref:Antitoxin n=2 Tax=Gracilinema caldarium TaxID=215591 RepID=F8EYJ7_GRAC1|nr:DUF6364 family protein [Gracilinema caldarium]AEJ18429.1 hypothetical protein Spica_0262 [Gracilinema caldarium DSM 7334]
MLSKLTLTIDQSIIEKAKDFAQKKNKSVSRIVEEYLRNISVGNERFVIPDTMKAPITDNLVGMFKDDGKDYKIQLEEALSEKYL